MLSISALPLNATVSFDLYPSAILGTGYQGAKVLAILDAETAKFFGIDPIARHANVYPTLPVGTPNKYDGYPYIKLQLASGEITAIGLPWIKDETLVVSSTRSMRFTVFDVSAESQELIKLALSSNGFSAVDVEYLD